MSNKLPDGIAKKKVLSFKVNKEEEDEIRSILSISEHDNLSELIRYSIFFYGSSIKEGVTEEWIILINWLCI